MTRMTAALSAAALTSLLLTACGGGGSGTDTSSGSSDASPSTSSSAGTTCPPAGGAKQRVGSFSAAPPMCIDTKRAYLAKITTDAGAITLQLDAKKAPKTVNNFVVLSRYHYYDGVTFHRVIPGFMIQGGDPDGTGAGGPGYEFADELPKPGEYQVGSLAMANAGPNTNGSQFFIVTGDAGVALPPSYSLFGKVTSGLDVVKAIEADGSEAGTPSRTHTIKSVTITEK